MSKFFAIAFFILWSAVAYPQDASHTDAAKELLRLSNAQQAIEQAHELMYPQLSAMADQLGVTEEQQPIFDRHMERMVVVMKEELSWEKMEPLLVRTYVSVYSEDELRELSEFYASPLGQKFIARMPELMQATMEMTQDMLAQMMPRMTEVQKELQAELLASKNSGQ